MRKPLLALVVALSLLSGSVRAAHAGLILSELCDPLNNYPTDRFIEVFNSGPGDLNLTGYSVVAIANGVDVMTWPLSGTLPAGQARVCGNGAASGFTVHFANSAWTTTVTNQGSFNWNGKVGDGAKIVGPGSVIVDLINVPGQVFTDGTLVRNSNVGAGSTSYVASEWTFTAVTLATQATPGTHNGGAPPPTGPTISNVTRDPATPAAGDPVHVFADVVDTARAITTVTLKWGSASGSLSNSIPMSLVAGTQYQTDYTITPQVAGASVYYRVDAADSLANSSSTESSFTIPGGGPGGTLVLSSAGQESDSTVLVLFDRPVDPITSQTAANYTVDGVAVAAAVRDPIVTSRVMLTVRGLAVGSHTLTVNGVADALGTPAYGLSKTFSWIDVSIPAGYYNGTAGLKGSALRKQLHLIIRNHTVKSYDFALTAFSTTDMKPNNKVWDLYSDVPGGTPAYEYAYGQTGQGAGEGFGYNREHTFPQSWFNSASPMVSDLHMLYPTDAYVNNRRANYPFGVVSSASWTSTNGSKLGGSGTSGYTGTVFEPIDPYKGDLARAQFYVAARYFGQDGAWPGSPSTDGCNYLPWAVAQYKSWSIGDPVSFKERARNAAVYAYQGNRNPFIDHPEFIIAIYDSNAVTGVGDRPQVGMFMAPASPNPFRGNTQLSFTLDQDQSVTLEVYDVGGRRVRVLEAGRMMSAGPHRLDWDGRDDRGQGVEPGLFFLRLATATRQATQRLVMMR